MNFNSVNVYAYSNAGVIAGKTYNSTIKNCKIGTCNVVTDSGNAALLVGCIEGGSNNTITSNTVNGTSSVKGDFGVAGFVGYSYADGLVFTGNKISGSVTVKYKSSECSGNGSGYASFIGNKADSTIDSSNTGSASFSSY